ncbi:MAG: SGNH/GDSL hydrolase family protein [Deltaproteobacteria bacterium]|nr:SGNH/GDSL hydrolase family protein [Deltaproteobacteria bacterium]
MIMLFPMLYDFGDYPFTEVHEKIRAFCREQGIPFLDLLPAYRKYRAEDLWVHPIDHHPNEIGHRIAAEELFSFLESHPDLWPCRAAESP